MKECHLTRLTVSDFRAILAQVEKPDMDYRIPGFILRLMAEELLESRAVRRRKRAPKVDRSGGAGEVQVRWLFEEER